MYKRQVCAAFIHDSSAAASKWVYSHEYGRHILENFTDGQVRTLSYENVRTDGEVDQAVEDAVRRGPNVIFTTTPKLLLSSVRQAALHPDVKILNCSLNTSYPSVRTYYPRLYGAKFIKGAIAGTLTRDGCIGYVADYPTYGSIASINAFAQGARMVNANARIYLDWAHLRDGGAVGRLQAQGIVYIDYLDRLAASTGTQMGNRHNLALIQTHWGRLYQSLVRRVMEGSWKQEDQGSSAVNYWWGMSSGVVDVLTHPGLPDGVLHLAEILKRGIVDGSIDLFHRLIPVSYTHLTLPTILRV